MTSITTVLPKAACDIMDIKKPLAIQYMKVIC